MRVPFLFFLEMFFTRTCVETIFSISKLEEIYRVTITIFSIDDISNASLFSIRRFFIYYSTRIELPNKQLIRSSSLKHSSLEISHTYIHTGN